MWKIAVKYSTEIHGAQKMNSNYFGVNLIYLLPPVGQSCYMPTMLGHFLDPLTQHDHYSKMWGMNIHRVPW